MNALLDVHICTLRENRAPPPSKYNALIWKHGKMKKRMPTERKRICAIAKVRILVEQVIPL